jgi:integrase
VKSLTNLYRDFYIAPIFEAAGLTGKTPHQFRHTFATKLLAKSVSLENVAVLLGNSPKRVWESYAAWVPARQIALDEDVKRANGWRHLEAEKPAKKPSKRKTLKNCV